MSEAERERTDGSVSLVRAALAEAVAADWVLEFSCYCLCRHFVEERGAEFRRWRDVAQGEEAGRGCSVMISGRRRISPLESALSFWTLLEREESKLDKLHEEIRRLIQIQVVAVYMEKGYYKEAAEVLERLFTDSESHKSLRMKLATVVKNKDPYVPLLQSFSFNLLLSKVKSYIDLFLKENATNFLLQAATKQLESKGGEVTGWQNKTVNVKEERENELEAEQSCVLYRPCPKEKSRANSVRRLEEWQTMKERGGNSCGRRRQPWTYDEDMKLKSGVREFGVGNWTKILIHGDFNNRTSVMLKDRWRTLCKIK
ncbi:hypothetical protein ASZ78_012932 [Callipepla squamata]|uniref:Uncharacterized protein n=1 Tax=Callipepla squamata TaxID=9009 RepID=A0A226NLZ5_CALSU|nr:hypothetical protein ASZ78_012932 [Callipepla squamata]